jgi:hypothetical protein
VWLDQLAERHHDTEFDAEAEHVVDHVAHRQPQLECRSLHRRRAELASATAAFVDTGDHQRHVVTGSHQRVQ